MTDGSTAEHAENLRHMIVMLSEAKHPYGDQGHLFARHALCRE